MKKSIVILVLIAVIVSIGYKVFYNGFSNIKSITIQKYDKPLKDGVITTDKDKIDTFTGILNRAKHKTLSYKLVNTPSYDIEINYNGKKNDILSIYQGFGKNKTLLYGNGNAYFINEKQTKKMLDLLLS